MKLETDQPTDRPGPRHAIQQKAMNSRGAVHGRALYGKL